MNTLSANHPAALGMTPAGTVTAVPTEILYAARDLCLRLLFQALKSLLNKADDVLFDLAQKSENNAQQGAYFDAMREVRLQRAAIEQNFAAALLQKCHQESQAQVLASRSGLATGSNPSATTMSVIDDIVMEKEIAVANCIEKMAQSSREQLFALNARMAVLLGKPGLSSDDNPLGPQAIGYAINQSLNSLQSGWRIQMIVLKLFERYVVPELDSIYDAVNALLIERHILPEIKVALQRPAASASRPASWSAPAAAGPATTNTLSTAAGSTPYDLFSSHASGMLLAHLHNLLLPNAGNVLGNPVDAVELASTMGTLTRLQRSAFTAACGESVMAANASVLRELKSQGLIQLNDNGGMTLDIVAMLFDYILDDKNLPDSLRALIARLQIPILKVALADRGFFSQKTHPARRLLNSIAELGAECTKDSALRDALMPIFSRVVQRLLDEFNDDVHLFAELNAALLRDVQTCKDEIKLRAERTARILGGQSPQELAKEYVRKLVDTRIQSQQLPEVVRSFVLTHWKRLLIQYHVQEGDKSETLKTAISTMDDLLWSVCTKNSGSERGELSRLLPGLLKRIKQGMETLSVPVLARTSFLTKLAKCHADAVRTGQPAAAQLMVSTHDAEIIDITAGTTAAAQASAQTADEDLEATVPREEFFRQLAQVEMTSSGVISAASLTQLLAPEVAAVALPENPAAFDDHDSTRDPPLPVLDLIPELSSVEATTEEYLQPRMGKLPEIDFDINNASKASPHTPNMHGEPLAPIVTDKPVMDAQTFLALFAAANGQTGKVDGMQIEEVSIGETNGDLAASLDLENDNYPQLVDNLKIGACLEMYCEDRTWQKFILKSLSADKNKLMFTDIQGNRTIERTRKGLITIFRQGGANVVGDSGNHLNILDRAFGRLLQGFGTR